MKKTVLKHSPYLEICVDDREVRYLGYVMPLTASEYAILLALAKVGGYHDKKSLCELMGKAVNTVSKSVAVHISAINRKALNMGGRKIIGTDRKKGYFIEKYV